MKIPEGHHSIQALIDKYHEDKQSEPRARLGASVLGHPCDRWLWLSFRWAVVPRFSGRLLRLFRRGQREEETIVEDLRAIGIDVRANAGEQTKIDLGCHLGGSVDAIIESGVPEAPKKRHIAEFKTHNSKSFAGLQKDGVQKAKPEHWVQMQLYMHGTKIDRALYVAVCKDDDQVYTERVRYDQAAAEKVIERGKRIVLSDRIPEPLSADPSWYICKWCPAHSFCFETKTTKQVNCRTCAHSTAKEDSTWRCERHDADGIPVDWQLKGCESHVLHPDLVPWPMLAEEAPDEWTAVYLVNGRRIANGEPDATVYASSEILANPTAVGDPEIEKVRAIFGGQISG